MDRFDRLTERMDRFDRLTERMDRFDRLTERRIASTGSPSGDDHRYFGLFITGMVMLIGMRSSAMYSRTN